MIDNDKIYKNLTLENMSTNLIYFESWHTSDITGVMPLAEIDAHMYDYPWSLRVLRNRRDMTLDFAVKWLDVKGIVFVSSRINATLEDIKRHEAYWLQNIDWSEYIQFNTSMTREIVHEYFEEICSKIPFSDRPYSTGFMHHLTFKMYLYYVGETKEIHINDELLDNEKLNIVLNSESHHANSFRLFEAHGDVNLSIIEKHPHIRWNIYYLASNPSNTVELFKKYEHDICARHVIRSVHNMTFDYLISNKNLFKNITHSLLLDVEYIVEKQLFEERKRREYMAAYRIQQWWLRVTSDPRNPVCQRRLEREYDEMFQVTPN
jgi:hypothetical protein